jgi:hypothetical protein
VFATLNGGRTWTNVIGNLPDAPASSSVIWHDAVQKSGAFCIARR